jgi:serine/threonine protein kinase/TolB-like protein
MTPERWRQIDQLYHDALERDAGRRAPFLDRACAGDAELRRDVESLLASHERAGGFIAEPALKVAARVLAGERAESLVGRVLAHYRVVSRLGAGGMGEVYLAEDTRLGRRVALKLLSAQLTKDEERVRRFRQEALAASALNHPNIITIHEIEEEGDRPYIATEFVDGVTLRTRMRGKRFLLADALDTALQILSALAAAHQAGIVHRDVKPENVMVRPDGLVKVLDFGIAKYAGPARGRDAKASWVKTATGVVVGTTAYMSPEQARGEAVDARTDLWAVGVILYEMVARRLPFPGRTPTERVAAILEREPAPLSRLRRGVPAELERVVGRALAKDKEERYARAADLAEDLRRLRAALGEGRPFRFDLHAPTRGLLPSRRRAVIAPVALAAAAALVVALAAYLLHYAQSGEAIDSVAVLPFANAGGDPDAEYLSDGISDQLINSLARLPSLKVISLSTVLRYKDRQIDPQAVGRELNVRAVLVGRMAQRGDALAISAELVDVRDSRRLWGGQYSRPVSDILAVQDEIAREIAEKLRPRLGGSEKRLLAKNYTENADAYHAYLKGRFLLDKRTVPTFEKSIEYFEQAIKLDSNYAPAYAGLSSAYLALGNFGARPPKEVMPKAREAAAKALEIDDTLAEAHAASGLIRLSDWDWPGSERAFRRALELNPNSGLAHSNYAYYLMDMRRFDEAVAETRRAVELEPTSVHYNRNFAIMLYYARRYDEAIEQCRKTLELDPNMLTVYVFLGKVYGQKGQYDQAVAESAKSSSLAGWSAAALTEAYAASGWRGYLRKKIDLEEEQAKQGYINPFIVAQDYALLGEKDQAFAWLEKSYEDHGWWIATLNADPEFDGLRPDPRYANLVRRMNLEP